MKASLFLFAVLFLYSCGERSVKEEKLVLESVQPTVSDDSDLIEERKFDPRDLEAFAAKKPLQELAPAPTAAQFQSYEGTYQFTYKMMEYVSRGLDFAVKVEVAKGNVRVIQEEYKVTGGPLIIEGYLFEHKSGVIIIVEREEQIEAEEVGGCAGAVIIDWDKKEIESC